MKKVLFILFLASAVAACSGRGNMESQNIGQSDELSSDSNVNMYKPKTEAEKEINENKWNTSRMETRWQDYKGTMVRVQILLVDTDIREIRLRLMPNSNGGDVDADNQTILAKVADFEMKRICGRNAKSIVIVYDQPAFDSMRATPYFDYRIEAEGTSMREYGFKCIYK